MADTSLLLREELLKHFGFRSSLTFPSNRVVEKAYFVARGVNEQIGEKIDIYNKANWRITHAYLDTT